jgi:DNA-binding HxlR family transcriptional regulator
VTESELPFASADLSPSEHLWEASGLFIQLLAGRWTLAVLSQLSGHGRRYQELHDALDGVSYKVLTETLRRAERNGLVARRLDGGRVETATLYVLTEIGQSLRVPLEAIVRWDNSNRQTVEQSRQQWDRLRRATG